MTAAVVTAARVAEAEGVVSGAVLRCFRRHLGYTQEALCDRLLIDVNTYRSWENGRRPLGRIMVARFHVLRRALTDLGIPAAIAGVLDVAVQVDTDLGRALASGDNLFPPPGCGDTWHALLAWALGGPAPRMFHGMPAEAPRLCPRDRRVLTARAGWECGG